MTVSEIIGVDYKIEFSGYMSYVVVKRDISGKIIRKSEELFRHEALDLLREWQK
jgi:hypothetical protein